MKYTLTRSGIRQNPLRWRMNSIKVIQDFLAKSTTGALAFCVGLLLLTSPLTVQAEDIELQASVDRDEIQIADPFELELRVTAPEGTHVSFPANAKTLGSFSIIDTKEKLNVPTSKTSGDTRLWVRTISLETLETGQLEIPTFEVAVKSAGQSQEILRTEAIAINVNSVVEPASDLTKFKDIAELHDVKVPASRSYNWIWLASGAALAITLAGGALLATCRKKSVSAKTWALQNLSAARDLTQAERIVRQFVEEEFGFAATSLPTDRILAVLRSSNVKDPVLQELQEFLQMSEQAKFGGLDLSPTQTNRLLNLAPKLVESLDQAGGEV